MSNSDGPIQPGLCVVEWEKIEEVWLYDLFTLFTLLARAQLPANGVYIVFMPRNGYII